LTNTVASENFRGGTHTGKRDNGGDIGIGGSMVSRVIVEALGINRTKLRETYRKIGDLGDAAAQLSASSKEKNSKRQKLLTSFFKSNSDKKEEDVLSVEEVFEKLRLVANTSGEKSEEKKRRILINLMRRIRSNPVDIRFLTRLLISANRCGASTTTMLCAISRASLYVGSEEEITKDMLKQCDDEVKYVVFQNSYH
jgi:ATP-dependent DNA ligase